MLDYEKHRALTYNLVQAPSQLLFTPQDRYFQLRFKDYALPDTEIPRPYVELLKKSRFFANGILDLSFEFTEDQFKVLYRFLRHEQYFPDLRPMMEKAAAEWPVACYLANHPTTTPPYIFSSSHIDTPPYLSTLVDAYHFARYLGFEPLASDALDRLDAPPLTLEDPIVILEYIYRPDFLTSPRPDIRTWVKRWLSVRLLDVFGPYAEACSTHLGVLERQLQFRERFNKLKDKSLYFAEDVEYVRQRTPPSRRPQKASSIYDSDIYETVQNTLPPPTVPIQAWPEIMPNTVSSVSPQIMPSGGDALSQQQKRLDEEQLRDLSEQLSAI